MPSVTTSVPVASNCQAESSIADHGVEGEIEGLQSFQEFLIDRLEQREVRFVIDHYDVGRRFLARFRALQLDVILIRHQIGGHEDPIMRQDGAEGALGEGRLLLPRSKIIVGLPGHVDPDQRNFLGLHRTARGSRQFLHRHGRLFRFGERDRCDERDEKESSRAHDQGLF